VIDDADELKNVVAGGVMTSERRLLLLGRGKGGVVVSACLAIHFLLIIE
jgi:hypothetical protein